MAAQRQRARGGDALARSAALLQAFEVGTCRIAGHLPSFEQRAVFWQSGQHQPDSLAALVVAHDVLVRAAGQRMYIAAPPLTGGPAKASDYHARLGRPDLPTLMARIAAERQAEADAETVGGPVTSMATYLARRIDGGGYDQRVPVSASTFQCEKCNAKLTHAAKS